MFSINEVIRGGCQDVGRLEVFPKKSLYIGAHIFIIYLSLYLFILLFHFRILLIIESIFLITIHLKVILNIVLKMYISFYL